MQLGSSAATVEVVEGYEPPGAISFKQLAMQLLTVLTLHGQTAANDLGRG